jgi:formyltetrahydrofolate hydrolase
MPRRFQRPGRLFYLYSVFCFISQSGPPPVETVVVAVLGGDMVGIVAGISNVLARHNVNIVDISQTVARDIFSMIMVVDISKADVDISQLR